MKKLITSESPKELIHAYMHNPIFHAVVNKHEIAESSYATMLEDAVAVLVQDVTSTNETLIQYARRFGTLDAPNAHQSPAL